MENVMAKRNKPIHLIQLWWSYECYAVCDQDVYLTPIEATNKRCCRRDTSKGTFNPEKVTCKRCLKHSDYKEAMDKIKYPLLHWRENI